MNKKIDFDCDKPSCRFHQEFYERRSEFDFDLKTFEEKMNALFTDIKKESLAVREKFLQLEDDVISLKNNADFLTTSKKK